MIFYILPYVFSETKFPKYPVKIDVIKNIQMSGMANLKMLVWESKEPSEEPTVDVTIPDYLARELKITISTLSEVIRAAQRSIIRAYLRV